MSANRHLLVFAEYGSINGGENSLLAIAPGLIAAGWKISAITPRAGELARALQSKGVDVVDFQLRDHLDRRLPQSDIRASLSACLEQIKPTVVLANSLAAGRLRGPVTREHQIPAVGYLRDILRLSKKAIADLNCLDRLIAVSHATRQWHIGQGIDEQKVQVIYNGVNTQRFQPADPSPQLQEQLGLETQHRVLLFVGQLGMRKGIDGLLKTFQAVQHEIADARLLMVGERHSQKQEAIEYHQRAVAFADELNSTCGFPLVHWLGRRQDICPLMNLADLLVHPARQEPLGRVILEACAAGLPAVCTDVGGTREILSGEWACDLICEPDHPEAMAARIVRLLEDESRRRQISVEVRTHAEQRFRTELCCSRVLELLEDLCALRQ